MMEVSRPLGAMQINTNTDFRLQMEPTSIEGLYKVAATVAKIQLCGVTSPEDALCRMLAGRELGLSLMQSMRGIYVVEGRPSLAARLKMGLCLSHSEVCETFEHVTSDDKHATFKVKRVGRAEKLYTYTIEEAHQALLVDRGKDTKQNNWHKHRRAMLEARAMSRAADTEFPELMFGLPSREEMEDERAGRIDPRGSITVDAEPSASRAVAPPVASTPVRNVNDEAVALKEDIMNAPKDVDGRKPIRERIAAFAADVGEPWASEVKNFYALTWAPKKEANGATQAPATGSSPEAAG
jgi:hypothetical protein